MRRIGLMVLCVLLLTFMTGALAAPILDPNVLRVDGRTYEREYFATLTLGDEGDLVEAVQNRLIELDYLVDKADGKFGARTFSAVMLFQKSSSLTRTGKLDFDTLWELMRNSTPAYEEEDFAISLSTNGKRHKKGKNSMTFQPEINNDSRYRTIKAVGLHVQAKDSAGDIIAGTVFTEKCTVKIAPGKSAYVPKIELPNRSRIRRIEYALAYVTYKDGTTVYEPYDPWFWVWDIAW